MLSGHSFEAVEHLQLSLLVFKIKVKGLLLTMYLQASIPLSYLFSSLPLLMTFYQLPHNLVQDLYLSTAYAGFHYLYVSLLQTGLLEDRGSSEFHHPISTQYI